MSEPVCTCGHARANHDPDLGCMVDDTALDLVGIDVNSCDCRAFTPKVEASPPCACGCSIRAHPLDGYCEVHGCDRYSPPYSPRTPEADPEPRALTHDLKCWPPYFDEVARGIKRFEVRRDDREVAFNAGHRLLLREYLPDPRAYTGREVTARVTYVLRHEEFPACGTAEGFVVLGIEVDDDRP